MTAHLTTHKKTTSPFVAPAKPGDAALPPAGFQKALALFQSAVVSIPAYRDFIINANRLDPATIKTPEDFKSVPEMTKANYLKKYPLGDMLWNGDLSSARLISMSSGSSGTPSAWPRGKISLNDSIELLRPIYENTFKTTEKTTLCVIAFAMGTWIGGTYVLGASLALGEEGHKITCITTGINRDEIISVLQSIAPNYQQVILAGYPPFIKDVLDEAIFQKVDLSSLSINFLLAGENISERMRNYLLSLTNSVGRLDVCVCLYGTADAGIMGNETPFSTLVRQRATEDPDRLDLLFPGATVLPTLVEYNAERRYLEVNPESYLLFTIQSELPLIRYNLLDKGRLPSTAEMLSVLPSSDLPLAPEFQSYYTNPHIALYGRSDVAAMFYALNIYPENIKYGIEHEYFQKLITGKFLVNTPYDEATQEQSFHIHLELHHGVDLLDINQEQLLFDSILESCRKNNSEYNKLHSEIGERAHPKLHFLPHRSKEFTIKIKHQWTIKP